MPTQLCPRCRVQNPRGQPFCKACGADLPGAIHPARPPGRLEPVRDGEGMLLRAQETGLGRSPDNGCVLTDPAVSRHHAVIRRHPEGYTVVDLGSLNGTLLNGRKVEGEAVLSDGDVLQLGNTRLRFSSGDARQLLPDRTLLVPAEPATPTPGPLPEPFARGYRPRRQGGWALKRQGEHYVLKHLERGTYLRLEEQDLLVWQLLDGRHTVQDLVVEHALRFGSLAPRRVQDFLARLAEHGFLATSPPDSAGGTRRRIWERRFPLPGVDALCTRLYRGGGWLFFTPPARIAGGVLVLVGLPVLVWETADGRWALLMNGGSLLWGLAGYWLAQLAVTLTHETAHALSCKSYGREVRDGGFLLYLGLPACYVDTSDIWLEPRAHRLRTSWAGPGSNLAMAGILALAVAATPWRPLAAFLFQVALLAALAGLVNLIPFLELDGYYLLVDWLDLPNLRRRALEALLGSRWRRMPPGKGRERLLPLFGVGFAAFPVLALAAAVLFWRHLLALLLGPLLPPGLLPGALAGAAALLLLTVLAGTGRSRQNPGR